MQNLKANNTGKNLETIEEVPSPDKVASCSDLVMTHSEYQNCQQFVEKNKLLTLKVVSANNNSLSSINSEPNPFWKYEILGSLEEEEKDDCLVSCVNNVLECVDWNSWQQAILGALESLSMVHV